MLFYMNAAAVGTTGTNSTVKRLNMLNSERSFPDPPGENGMFSNVHRSPHYGRRILRAVLTIGLILVLFVNAVNSTPSKVFFPGADGSRATTVAATNDVTIGYGFIEPNWKDANTISNYGESAFRYSLPPYTSFSSRSSWFLLPVTHHCSPTHDISHLRE